MNYENIIEMTEVDMKDVNDYLKKGWHILHIGMEAEAGYPFDGDQRSWTTCYMGLPRTYQCSCGSKPTTYIYDTNRWRCDNAKCGGNPALR